VKEGAEALFVDRTGGGWRFVHPDGRHFEVIRRTWAASYERSEPYEANDLERTHAALGMHIDRHTAETRWRGERMDYELGVWVLCNHANHARRARTRSIREDVSAETSNASQGQSSGQ
jgi:hypothetical protein